MAVDRMGGGTFLGAEDAAKQLAATLGNLNDEAGRYRDASSKLDTAAEATTQMAKSIEAVGEHVQGALEVIAASGGPEVLARIDELQDRSAAQAEASTLAIEGVEESLQLRIAGEMQQIEAAAKDRHDALLELLTTAQGRQLAQAQLLQRVVWALGGIAVVVLYIAFFGS